MGKAKDPEAVVTTPANGCSKASILRSERFTHRVDALSVLLKDDEFYTVEQVEKILDDFYKERVK